MLYKLIIVGVLCFESASITLAQLGNHVPAFPGAEGYGARTQGGRGGRALYVTNLNENGPGSLRAACEAEGPRIVLFKVAGTIPGDIRIANDFITIAGQTAPGEGITLKGNLSVQANDVIVRYLRVRSDGDGDAVSGRYKKNIIFDHVSASWGGDEVMSIYHCENVTVQYCIVSEAVGNGESHKFAAIWGSDYSSYHHNLIAHCDSRNPRWASGSGHVDYRNNVIYNWGYNSCYGGEAHQPGDRRNPDIEYSRINMVANYYKPGPATREDVRARIANPSSRDGAADAGQWWVAENVVVGSPSVTANNWEGVTPSGSEYRLEKPWPALRVTQESAEVAFRQTLETAGCSLPSRDAIDRRIVLETREGTATFGDGIISSPADVGGWPSLKSGSTPLDSDEDGMPDSWEEEYGFDAAVDDGAVDADNDGYTNLEEFINGTQPKLYVDYTKAENNINTLTGSPSEVGQ